MPDDQPPSHRYPGGPGPKFRRSALVRPSGAAVEPEPAPAPAEQPAPAEEAPARASWIDMLLANWYYAGAALLVLGLILFALTRRRQQPDYGNFGKLADAARSSGGGGGGAVVREREPRIEREPVTTPLRAKAVDEVDEGVHFHDGRVLSIDAEIREAVILGIPMKPLCRETCAGLCPRCGEDRNEGPCRCERAAAG